MQRFKGVAILVASVLVVGVGVALAGRSLISPSSPNQSVTNLANSDHPATTERGEFDGAHVRVIGDVTGEFHVEGGEPSMDGKHETFTDGTSLLSFARDKQGAYVDHLIYADLDFYLGRDDCETEVGQADTDTGFATATFSCTDIGRRRGDAAAESGSWLPSRQSRSGRWRSTARDRRRRTPPRGRPGPRYGPPTTPDPPQPTTSEPPSPASTVHTPPPGHGPCPQPHPSHQEQRGAGTHRSGLEPPASCSLLVTSHS